jgi:hypothetical protein
MLLQCTIVALQKKKGVPIALVWRCQKCQPAVAAIEINAFPDKTTVVFMACVGMVAPFGQTLATSEGVTLWKRSSRTVRLSMLVCDYTLLAG